MPAAASPHAPPRTAARTAASVPGLGTPASIARLRRKLLCFAMRELRNADLAEDVTQETLIVLMEHPGRFRGDARFDVFAIGVLRHKIADHFRAARREAATEPDTIEQLREAAQRDEAGDASSARPQDPADTLDAIRDRDRFWPTLRACLASMPEAHRTVFVLRDVQGWSMDAVCSHLGITPTHVSVLAHRARAHLQVHLPTAARTALAA